MSKPSISGPLTVAAIYDREGITPAAGRRARHRRGVTLAQLGAAQGRGPVVDFHTGRRSA